MCGTAVIRDRGQLTIPEKIRGLLKWSSPNSVVSLCTTTRNELIIRPYNSKEKTLVDWDSIWMNIDLSRSYKGKRGNLSEFVSFDRESH
ncbi:MAG: hypothetical protein ACD_22C00266G0003 [uncultured bacterium]|nr:MAG: hypothetical protein ACD_22C00266G0003 [uncultured bacterium]